MSEGAAAPAPSAHDPAAHDPAGPGPARRDHVDAMVAAIRRRALIGRLAGWIVPPLLVLALLAVWEAAVVRDMSGTISMVVPRPSAVLAGWWGMLGDASIWDDTWFTAEATLQGFGWAAVSGITLGLLVGKLRWLEVALNPIIVTSQVVPKIALVPLFLLWFGFGITTHVVIAAVLAFFPLFSNTVLGVKSVAEGHREVMRALQAGPVQTALRLDLPSAMPAILTGAEVAIVLALIGAVVGEYLSGGGGGNGLGAAAYAAQNGFDPVSTFANVLQLTLLGLAMQVVVVGLRRWLVPWLAAER